MIRRLISWLLLALLTVASSASADTFFRLYPVHAGPMLDNLIANPAIRSTTFADVHLHLIVARPEEEAALIAPIATKAALIGMRVVYGFRLMDSKPPGGWADSERWQRNAYYLSLLLAAGSVQTGDLFAFDDEDYMGAMPVPSPEAFRAAAAPFLDTIRASGIVPCLYPATFGQGDVAAEYILDAVGGRGELWSEYWFGFSEQVRLSPEKVAASENGLLRYERAHRVRWPLVTFRHGAFDHHVRGLSGSGSRAAVNALGPAWSFDLFRYDNLSIGKPEWVSGATLHSSNDAIHVSQIRPDGSVAAARGTPLAKAGFVSTLPPARADLRSTAGFLATPGVGYRAEMIPRPAVAPLQEGWLALEAVLPPAGSGAGALFSASADNSPSWTVRLVETATSSRLALQLSQPAAVVPGGELMITMRRDPPRGVSTRIAVALRGSTWSWAIGADPIVSFRPPARAGLGAGNVFVGWAHEMRRDPVTGKRRPYDAPPGTAFRSLEVGHRAVTDTELQRLAAQAFPRTKP